MMPATTTRAAAVAASSSRNTLLFVLCFYFVMYASVIREQYDEYVHRSRIPDIDDINIPAPASGKVHVNGEMQYLV